MRGTHTKTGDCGVRTALGSRVQVLSECWLAVSDRSAVAAERSDTASQHSDVVQTITQGDFLAQRVSHKWEVQVIGEGWHVNIVTLCLSIQHREFSPDLVPALQNAVILTAYRTQHSCSDDTWEEGALLR